MILILNMRIGQGCWNIVLSIMTNHVGALSMAAGEYISVASQKDTELADVDKERQQQEAGPATRAHELEELAQIYVSRGLDYELAKKARAFTAAAPGVPQERHGMLSQAHLATWRAGPEGCDVCSGKKIMAYLGQPAELGCVVLVVWVQSLGSVPR